MAVKKSERKAQSEFPYGLDPKFERVVAGYCSTSPTFMRRVGFVVNPELLVYPPARLVVAAAIEVYKETGRGSSSTIQVLQRIRRQVDAGKVTVAEVGAVSEMLSEFVTNTAEGGSASQEAAVAELAPVLKKNLRLKISNLAVRAATEDDLTDLREAISLFDKVGVADTSGQTINSSEKAMEAIDNMRTIERKPCGIQSIDNYLQGGPPQGTLTTFMASTGGGKSMVLSHILAYCMNSGIYAAYATLEIPSEHVMARALACRSGITIDAILKGAKTEAAGMFAVADFAAKATTVADIAAWLRQEEDYTGKPVEVLLVDYADLLSAGPKEEKGTNTYQSQGVVYTELRDLIRQKNMVGYTASQSRGREERDGKKRLDIQHASDSSNKPRLVDHWITVNPNEETQEIDFFFAKNRYGEGRKSASPSPYNFALGRVGPWVDEAVPARSRVPGEDDMPAVAQLALVEPPSEIQAPF